MDSVDGDISSSFFDKSSLPLVSFLLLLVLGISRSHDTKMAATAVLSVLYLVLEVCVLAFIRVEESRPNKFHRVARVSPRGDVFACAVCMASLSALICHGPTGAECVLASRILVTYVWMAIAQPMGMPCVEFDRRFVIVPAHSPLRSRVSQFQRNFEGSS